MAAEHIVTPGFVDVHVHLREPGNNPAETIESGTRAAMLGGYALIGDMPNTPGQPTWSLERLQQKHRIASQTAHIPTTYHIGSQPESDNIGELAKMAPYSLWLKLYGAPTTGNDRDYEASDFRDIAKEFHRVAPDKPIGLHAGRNNLQDMIGLIAGDLDHSLHIHHVSSSHEVKTIQLAKAAGNTVTSGVCPHHLLKTSHDVRSEGWFARMQPPLAEQAEAEELMRYLADDEIDIIETDHAPHMTVSKHDAEDTNPEGIHDPDHSTCFGVPGIEFAAPLMFYQAKRGFISMDRLVDAMSARPAEILGVKLDSQTQTTWRMEEYRIGEEDVQSASNWTPFAGKLAIGTVNKLTVDGSTLINNGRPTGDRSKRVVSSRGTVI